MEPLSALGLACNLMQLISFSREVLSFSKRAAASGSVEPELADRAASLSGLSASLDRVLGSLKKVENSSQRNLQNIAIKCRDASWELQKELDKLGPQKGGGGALRAFGSSLKTVIRKNRPERLEKDMLGSRQVLDSGLQHHICSTNEALALEQRQDFRSLEQLLQEAIQELARGNSKLMDTFDARSLALQSHVTSEASKTRDAITQHVDASVRGEQQHLTKNIHELRISTEQEAVRQRVLKSLKFNDMNHRQSMIAESYQDTFNWIFLPNLRNCDSFSEWLGADETFYWISGKAGSGKSTLMKFIINNQKTKELLKHNTIVLSYYLWSPGNQIPKSIRGTLCALLRQLLVNMPSLIGLLFQALPSIAEKDSIADWSQSEIKRCLALVIAANPGPICLFLDGLDEIDAEDGPTELMDLIDDLSKPGNIKFCIASRPEPVFQDRYGSRPRLRLQDLTEHDIRDFSTEFLQKLRGTRPQDDPSVIETGFDELVTEVIKRAEGVFLWVHLALKGIQRGFSNHDSWEILRKRIQSLPPGLDDLYRSMWKRANIDQGVYERSASHYLALVLLSTKHLPFPFNHGLISIFELLVASEPSIQRAFLERHEPSTPEQLRRRCIGMRKEIESHCAGLVEVSDQVEGDNTYDRLQWSGEWEVLRPMLDTKVGFIHRTAADFLTDTEFGKEIIAMDSTKLRERVFCMLRACCVSLEVHWTSWTATSWTTDWTRAARRSLKMICRILLVANHPPELSESETESLLDTCEAIWSLLLKPVTATGVSPLLPDFLGIAGAHGYVSFVMRRLDEMEEQEGMKVSDNYLRYLFAQSCDGVMWHFPEKVWNGKLLLLNHLLDRGVKPTAEYMRVRCYSHEGPHMPVRVATPVLGILDSLLRYAFPKYRKHDLAINSLFYDTISRLVETGASLREKHSLALLWTDSNKNSLPHVEFGMQPSSDQVMVRFDVSTAMLLGAVTSVLATVHFETQNHLAFKGDIRGKASAEVVFLQPQNILASLAEENALASVYPHLPTRLTSSLAVDKDLFHSLLVDCLQANLIRNWNSRGEFRSASLLALVDKAAQEVDATEEDGRPYSPRKGCPFESFDEFVAIVGLYPPAPFETVKDIDI